jgi:hypothetical protein
VLPAEALAKDTENKTREIGIRSPQVTDEILTENSHNFNLDDSERDIYTNRKNIKNSNHL